MLFIFFSMWELYSFLCLRNLWAKNGINGGIYDFRYNISFNCLCMVINNNNNNNFNFTKKGKIKIFHFYGGIYYLKYNFSLVTVSLFCFQKFFLDIQDILKKNYSLISLKFLNKTIILYNFSLFILFFSINF